MSKKARVAKTLNSVERISPSDRRALQGPPELPATRLGIFVSSVQKELAEERQAVKSFVEGDPLLRRFFSVFLFEDLAASDRRAGAVYLAAVDRCAVYVGIFGYEYGVEDDEGCSPTEHEFERATATGKPRLIFVKGADDRGRAPKMKSLIRRAGRQLIRRRFGSSQELTAALYASLVNYLEACGTIQTRPFEDRPCPEATLDDVDARAVTSFVHLARLERQFPLPVKTPTADVLAHLHLLHGDRPGNAAILLFGRDPQRFHPSAEVRCMHFHGTEIQRPVPFYRVFKGTLFEQVDMAVDFVLSKLNRSVGTRAESNQAPVRHEIPPDVIREAIVNAIAHRDYTTAGAVQVSVFADRVEVWNPGALLPPLTLESLRRPHGSIARNPRICEALFLAHYIEKYGTGTLMMIRESLAHALPEPDFAQRGGEFTITIWRDWLTDAVMDELGVNERQRKAIAFVKTNGRITNKEYQGALAVSKPTASRDLELLRRIKVFTKVGSTGKGTYYVLSRKGLSKGS
ncbi:MAG: ATP-binding protein [candidate division NC10 bacterium]